MTMEFNREEWINYPTYWGEHYPSQQVYTYKFVEEEKEKTMSLTKKYLNQKKNDNDKKAIELGVMNEDGTLTSEGKELLLAILLEDKDIRAKFDKVVESLLEEEEDGE